MTDLTPEQIREAADVVEFDSPTTDRWYGNLNTVLASARNNADLLEKARAHAADEIERAWHVVNSRAWGRDPDPDRSGGMPFARVPVNPKDAEVIVDDVVTEALALRLLVEESE